MKPIDCRNKTFSQVRQDLQGRLAEVYTAWVCHGPCTTRQLAEKSGIDILNVRPRTTDLVGVGLVDCIDTSSGEGVYLARSQPDWEAWHGIQFPDTNGQMALI